MTSDNFDYYTSNAEELANKYPVDIESVASMDFAQWAKDSYNIAVDDVYAGKSNARIVFANLTLFPCPKDFVEGEIPSQEYIDRAVPAIEAHMMLGARRLADTMVQIYGTQSASLFPQ